MEFKIGDKVKIPKTKQGKVSNFYSSVLEAANKKKQDYLYYNGISGWASEYVLNDTFDPDNLTGDFFNLNEIELYEEEFPKVWCLEITKESFPFIQKTHSDFEDFKDYTQFSNRYLRSDHSYGHRSIKKPSEEYPEITLDQFKKHILKESTIMKNLLETEFVIENCTLSQRLAIKAYCDEKNIKYASKYTFEDKVFNALVWDKTEFLNYDTDRKDKRDRVTFSELIQFLDQYQPEQEFKKGDLVYFTGKSGFITEHWKVGKIFTFEKIHSNPLDFIPKEGGSNKLSNIRHATPEEIKKWKEENETKLPRIADEVGIYNSKNKTLRWGCTEISISTVKELLELKLTHINFDDGREADYKQIQQIKKFIEHNKL